MTVATGCNIVVPMQSLERQAAFREAVFDLSDEPARPYLFGCLAAAVSAICLMRMSR